jgi:alkylated DNA repair dioxygenase AlkB
MKVEIATGYAVEYIEDCWSKEEANELLRDLLAIPMTPETVKLYGKTHETKRRSAQYGMEYNYNVEAKKSQTWTPLMLRIKERMERIAGPLDGGLVQVYPSGDAGIGWHHDKGDPEIIASVSLGAQREFTFGQVSGKSCVEKFRMRLSHGSLLLVPADVNRAYKHSVPIAKRIKEPRVNVTLRRFPRARN